MPYTPEFEGVKHDLKQTFLDGCVGVGLCWRGENDPHVLMVMLICDDDGYCYEMENSTFSAWWLPSLNKVLGQAELWMIRNCDPEMDAGWRFRV